MAQWMEICLRGCAHRHGFSPLVQEDSKKAEQPAWRQPRATRLQLGKLTHLEPGHKSGHHNEKALLATRVASDLQLEKAGTAMKTQLS